MDFMIVRDQRTGGPYTAEAAKADKEQYGNYANEAADIEVEINEGPYYHGSGEPDDPSSVDVSGGARVCNDVPKCDPITGKPTGEFVFRAGQVIELTGDELQEAHDKAIEEAEEAAIPEYAAD
jgi:hypothetical protein